MHVKETYDLVKGHSMFSFFFIFTLDSTYAFSIRLLLKSCYQVTKLVLGQMSLSICEHAFIFLPITNGAIAQSGVLEGFKNLDCFWHLQQPPPPFFFWQI